MYWRENGSRRVADGTANCNRSQDGLVCCENKLLGRTRFPFANMFEPLEKCNLACVGCARIKEYESVIDRMLTVDQYVDAVEVSGAPIVSIAGGELTLHFQIDEIVSQIISQKKNVYLCTNALLLERVMQKIPPSKYFCFVVHLDGHG